MTVNFELKARPSRALRLRLQRDLVFFALAGFILGADQFLSWYISGAFDAGEYWPSRDWPVRITYVENTGAAFGILQDQGVFLVVSTVLGLAAILLYYLYPPFEHGLLRLALALQLGGALGNLIDRLRQGYVVDYINTSFWPTFNLADSAITIGMLVLVGFLLLGERGARRRRPPRSPPEP